MKFHRALISVSDKKGIIELARVLTALGIDIISSGGTAKTLTENNIPCSEISQVTGFPEILDGRVKTLNPKIHGGILAMRNKKTHMQELKKHQIEPIDIVIVNLYPFEETVAKSKTSDITEDIIENIDIGGVALLRAAAKNFNDVIVLSSPDDYSQLIENLKSGNITPEYRRSLASKAFSHTAYYDSMISGFFSTDKFPETVSVPLRLMDRLRYGENPHQEAALYSSGGGKSPGTLANAKQLQGKELSYNNYLDLDSAWRLIQEFEEPACAIIKHNNPCGCAEGDDLLDAYKRALSCDTSSAFGGIIAFNREVNEVTAAEATKLFTECIIAPSYTEKAKSVFALKKNLRVLELPIKAAKDTSKVRVEFKSIDGGMLIQERDATLLNEIKTITQRIPSETEMKSLKFAWKVCKHVKSNAIILAKGTQAVGIGAGQMSRIDSLRIASEKMNLAEIELGAKLPLVLASDAFFPFPDVVNESAKIGVKAIIQPGGSMKDEDSIKAANTNKQAMVFTGTRHFKH